MASSGWRDQELDHSRPTSPAPSRVVWTRREYSVTYAAEGMNWTAAPAAPATEAARKRPKRRPPALHPEREPVRALVAPDGTGAPVAAGTLGPAVAPPVTGDSPLPCPICTVRKRANIPTAPKRKYAIWKWVVKSTSATARPMAATLFAPGFTKWRSTAQKRSGASAMTKSFPSWPGRMRLTSMGASMYPVPATSAAALDAPRARTQPNMKKPAARMWRTSFHPRARYGSMIQRRRAEGG